MGKPVIKNFHSQYDDGSRKWTDASALLQFCLMFFTWFVATKLAGLKTTNWATPLVRKILGSFGVTISILAWTGMASIWSNPDCTKDLEKAGQCIRIDFLKVPSGFSTSFLVAGTPRPWLQSPFLGAIHDGTTGDVASFGSLPIWAIFFAIVPAAVVEQRVTGLGIHILIILCVFLASILNFVPKAVLLGVFLFMGVSSLNGDELWERLQLYFIWDSSKFPRYSYVKKCTTGKIHLFTFLQFICLGVLYALKSMKSVAVVFPFFIASLVGVRYMFKFFFSQEELQALDGHDEEEEVANDDPDSPLKRTQVVADDVPAMITNKERESGFSPVGTKNSPTKNAEMPVILGQTQIAVSGKMDSNTADSV